MNEAILNTILENTYTLSQLKRRLSALKQLLLKEFFKSDSNQPAPAIDTEWLKSLPSEFLKQFNNDNVYKIFEDIESQIIKLPIVTIYLTFEPDEATLSQIGQRAKKTFNKLLIFDIKYDPRLIAGAALVCKGVYRDYSLRSKIEEKRLIILNNFKKFLK